MPMQGQIGQLTTGDTEGIEPTFRIPALVDSLVAIVVFALIVIALIAICKHRKDGVSEHQGYEGNMLETKVYEKIHPDAHSIAVIMLYGISFAVSLVSCLCYEPYDLATNYYFVAFSLTMGCYHVLAHECNLVRSGAAESAAFLIVTLVVCFIKDWNAWLVFAVSVYSYHQEWSMKTENVVKRSVLTQNILSSSFSIYFYLRLRGESCEGITVVAADWIVYSFYIACLVLLCRRRNFNLLILALNLALSTGYMMKSFNDTYCSFGPWSKSYITVAFVTSFTVAVWSIILFASNREPTALTEMKAEAKEALNYEKLDLN